MLEVITVNALVKLFPDALKTDVVARRLVCDRAARGEIYSFGVAVRSDTHGMAMVEADFGGLPGRLRAVETVPCRFNGVKPDADMISTAPGLYPDLLGELECGNLLRLPLNLWRMLWITVAVPRDAVAGERKFVFRFRFCGKFATANEYAALPVTGEALFTLDVADFELPEQTLLRDEWFHTDCLASYYQVEAWSEPHWRIVRNFAANAVAHGINVLYTPLWTPPLDTGIGLERPDCQLLEIAFDPATGVYSFDFTRLRRYLEMGLELGFKAFAMSHLFTQWGAKATPAIRATVAGEKKRIFGWDKASDSDEYRAFLTRLFPPLLALLREYGLEKRVFFSLSDEPHAEHLELYSKLVDFVHPLLDGFPTIEALSQYEFYRAGLIRNPIPGLNHIEDFRGKVERLWGYYCVSQNELVPNRFIAMPSRRTRVLGILAYVYDLTGFLHWGFNFYFTQYSRGLVDPLACTDAGGAFPGGDPFIVYPGRDGAPLDSIRHEVFTAGLQDLRALRALEAAIGRAAVLELLSSGLKQPLSMAEYPRSDEWLLDVRRRVYEALARRGR